MADGLAKHAMDIGLSIGGHTALYRAARSRLTDYEANRQPALQQAHSLAGSA